MLRDMLSREGFDVGRRHVATLMRRMGIEALYRKPNTSKRHPAHKVYPYLLRGLTIERANQVWAMDITYIPMARGFVYLAAVWTGHSRRVLAHRVSITHGGRLLRRGARGSARQVRQARDLQHRPRQPVHQRRRSPTRCKSTRIAISMDGRGRWRDNVFVERLWQSVKYEEVYLHAYDSVSAARAGICRYIDFYNARRPHRAHGGQTPDMVYFKRCRNSAPPHERRTRVTHRRRLRGMRHAAGG